MADFKLTDDGDLDLTNGLVLVEGVDEMFQRYLLGYSIRVGEFFTHINYGLPWIKDESNPVSEDIEYFMGLDSDVTIQYIIKELDDFTESLEFIDSVSSTYEYDAATRQLTYYPEMTTTTGEIIDFPPYVQEV